MSFYQSSILKTITLLILAFVLQSFRLNHKKFTNFFSENKRLHVKHVHNNLINISLLKKIQKIKFKIGEVYRHKILKVGYVL